MSLLLEPIGHKELTYIGERRKDHSESITLGWQDGQQVKLLT